VIRALAIQFRRPPIPHLAGYEGLGVAYAVDSAREQLRSGDSVVVVGGANSAGQAALAFADEGRTVHIVVRGDSLQRSMARYLRDRIAAAGLDILLGHEVRQVSGDAHLERVTVEATVSNRRSTPAH
jgi:thioredoxin reductase (NADPH)